MDFSEILIGAFFIIPVVAALISASKGISKEDAVLPCSACKSLIPVKATVCPYCRRSAGHDYLSKKGKALDNQTKSMRFFRTLVFTYCAEFVIGILLIFLFGRR